MILHIKSMIDSSFIIELSLNFPLDLLSMIILGILFSFTHLVPPKKQT